MKALKTHQFIISPPKPTLNFFPKSIPNVRRNTNGALYLIRACRVNPIAVSSTNKKTASPNSVQASAASSVMASSERPAGFWESQFVEEAIEKVIYRCRFVTLLGVCGSLIGAVLCFIKGCNIVVDSFIQHAARSGKAMVMLVEATDVYLLGTVMMVFGMGLYELFVCNLDIVDSLSEQKGHQRSNLFGLFTLMERPQWLEIKSVNELKTKVGHVIVMLLLIGLFDNSKKAAINTPTDLLCFSASVLLCSCCLYLLSKLNGSSK